jgi:N-terminal acetyltransferase B complex non-catalytic subunit
MYSDEMKNVDKQGRTGSERRDEALSSTEESYNWLYESLATIAAEVFDMQPRFWGLKVSLDEALAQICEELDADYESYRFFIDDANDPEPVSRRLCSERDLMYSYGLLEVLLLIARLIPTLRDIIRQKSHRLHSKISKSNVEKLFQKTQDCHRIVLTTAQCDIDRLKKTGEALKAIISDRKVEIYAKEYVESAIEAYSGILKVKLN